MSKLPPNPWLKPIRDVLLTGLALVGLYYVLEVVVYFLAAAALTLLGRPIHTLLRSVRISRRWGVSSSAAALITVLGFFALLAGLLWLIVPPVVSQVVALSNTDPHKMVEALQEPLNALYKQLDKWGLGSEANEIIHSAVADLRANLL
ncbi:MAG: AI-2E family transporter, partial [Sphingobacteriia bacterium]